LLNAFAQYFLLYLSEVSPNALTQDAIRMLISELTDADSSARMVHALTAEVYKTLIVGPRNVGKSSLVRRYLLGRFETTYTATVGADLSVATFDFPEGTIVLSVVDLGGQQTFAALRNRFYQGAHHVILVYDKTDRSTFEDIPKWYETLTDGIRMPSYIFLAGSLVANKVDMTDAAEVTEEEGRQLADLLSMKYFEASAKTGTNVAEIFIHAASSCRARIKSSIAEQSSV